MFKKGWTENSIATTRMSKITREAFNRANGDKATAYFNKDASYIVIDNASRDVIQISNRLDPKWIPDATIVNPYIPK